MELNMWFDVRIKKESSRKTDVGAIYEELTRKGMRLTG